MATYTQDGAHEIEETHKLLQDNQADMGTCDFADPDTIGCETDLGNNNVPMDTYTFVVHGKCSFDNNQFDQGCNECSDKEPTQNHRSRCIGCKKSPLRDALD